MSGQAQDALFYQLRRVVRRAEEDGEYDAADWIRKQYGDGHLPASPVSEPLAAEEAQMVLHALATDDHGDCEKGPCSCSAIAKLRRRAGEAQDG